MSKDQCNGVAASRLESDDAFTSRGVRSDDAHCEQPVEEALKPSADSVSVNEALMEFLYRAPIGLLQISATGVIEMINPMSARLLMPLSPDGNLVNLFDVLEAVAPQFRRMVQQYTAPAGPVCDAVRITVPRAFKRNASSQVLSVSLLKLDENHLMAMVSDVTLESQREQSVLDKKLGEAARLDKLTMMPNRTSICEFIENNSLHRDADRRPHFGVLFINCDRFKQINDSLGHSAGDEVLAEVANRLMTTMRLPDAQNRQHDSGLLAGRLGGDEFVVVIGEPRSESDVHSLADRLLAVLSEPYRIADQHLHLSVSIGIVHSTTSSAHPDAILQDASIAMVEAKRRGGARYVSFEPSMHERAARRAQMENDLRRAIVNQELFVVYQPVVMLASTVDRSSFPPHAAAVEALVRWRHPVRGVVPPVEFIGVAEECGLIGALGEFVLDTACRQFVAWKRELGRLAPRLLAVNLSRAQLNEEGFVAYVSRTLRESGMAPAELQLEVTESLAAQDESVQATLRQLQLLGLTLALDDFGTGYSSLSSLHQLPVATVKIDRSFVSQAEQSAHHRVLIEATVRVAASLDMNTVAEGVETEAQASVVRSLGCEKGQGYFFSKPLVSEDLVEWLKSNDA
ncbi:EAL domain-containing protein [Caballeronia sp. LZ062]|uniref:putative bifunctional diguanylate cyclase/phosphodiesterase n=1 Tax=unclassified Caballeronia TaxID=2646786 RepID=UPI002859B520|nr:MULTISPECIES: EAL domain-containing protein [unclassified Caballeronia]MDR5857782.1 EAL domain-containing protein [Caballeronia sp. LZ050]MDR5869332.1 EAL domain-containing protein [Caballeronia sp. LZ062]